MSEQNLQNIEKKVDSQIAKANREKMTTLVGYTIITIIIIGYMLFLRSQTSEFTTDSVVEVAIGTAEGQIKPAKDALISFVDNEAEGLINTQVDELVKIIPVKADELETFAKEQLDKTLIIADESFSELFANTLTSNRAELEPMLEKIESSQSLEDFEELFYKGLRQQFDEPGLVANLASYGDALNDLADRLAHLRQGEGLSETERIERELLICLKSIAKRAESSDLELVPSFE